MKIMHRVVLGYERTSIEKILEAVERFNIPNNADLFESEESYDLVIEWAEGDE